MVGHKLTMRWKFVFLSHLLPCFTTGSSTVPTSSIHSTIPDPVVLQLVEEYRELCPFTRLCRADNEFPVPNVTYNFPEFPCCLSCDCDGATPCQHVNSCCPDEIPRILSDQEIRAILDDPVRCTHIQFIPQYEAKYSGSTFNVMSKCPSDFEDADTRRKCEREYIEFDFSENPLGFIPVGVVVPLTITIYKNKFCAECYGFRETIHLEANMRCFTNDGVILNNLQDIVTEIGSKKCNVIFDSPFLGMFASQSCRYRINQCNVTGQWTTYDEKLEAACLSYTSEYKNHKNIHCYMCNGHEVAEVREENSTCRIDPGASVDTFAGTIDLASLIEAYEANNHTDPRCSSDARYDSYTKSCRRLHCPQMMFLSGDRCVPFYRKLEQPICFHIRIRLIPHGNSHVDITALTSLGDRIKRSMDKKLLQSSARFLGNFEFTLKLDTSVSDISAETVNQMMLLYIDIEETFYTHSDSTNDTLDLITELYNIDFGVNDEFTTEFEAIEEDLFEPNAPIKMKLRGMATNVNEAFQQLVDVSTDETDGFARVGVHYGGDFGCPSQVYVTPSQFSPKVVLENTHFTRRIDIHGLVTVTVLGHDVNVTDVIFFDGYNKTMMCENVYFDIVEKIEETIPVSRSVGSVRMNIVLMGCALLLPALTSVFPY